MHVKTKTSIALAFAAFVCAALAARDVRAAETIRSTDGIRSVSMMDAAPPGVPFDVTGLIVYLEKTDRGNCNGHILIKDNFGLVSLLNYLSATNAPIREGDYVRATGRVVLERNGINIYAHCFELTYLAHKEPEPPIRLTIKELLSGQHDGQLVTVRGEIRDSFPDDIDDRFMYFSLKDGEKSIYMATSTNRCVTTDRDSIIGDLVEATGIWILGEDNVMRRHIGRLLQLFGNNSLRTIKACESDIFNAREIADVRSLMPNEVPFLDRRRITGTVLASWQGNQSLVKTDDGSIVRIGLTSPPVPEAGRRIEAVGFPETDLYAINLNNVRWRAAQGNPKPPQSPVRLPEGYMQMGGATPQRMQAAFHGRTVIVTGIVRGLPQSEGDRRLILECEGNLLPIDFSSCPDAISGLEIGCTVEVRGVWVMVADNWRPNSVFPKVKGAFVVVNAPDDLRVLSRPPWWTAGRLLAVIGALLVMLAWIFAWNRILNRRAEKRGRQLYDERVAHVRTEAKVEERTRLAVELHDAISQTLTGVALQVDSAARANGDESNAVGAFLKTSCNMLASCRRELKDCLWDLRGRTFEEKDMTEAIVRTISPHKGDADASVRFNVPRERLSESTTHTILSIVRELVVNAIRHGKATHIWIAGEYHDGRITFSVRDNGCGFDAASAPGPLDGHFGLQGVRERVKESGGTVDIASTPGHGTKVTVSITLSSDEGLRTSDSRRRSPMSEVRSQKTTSIS